MFVYRLSPPFPSLSSLFFPKQRACSQASSFAACYCQILCFLLFFVFNWNASIFLASKPHVRSFYLYKFDHFSRDTSHVNVRPIKTFWYDKPRRKFFRCTLVRENLSNLVQNWQTSSCCYKSGNHGLTKSSHQVFNYVAVTESSWRWLPRGCIFVAEFLKFR